MINTPIIKICRGQPEIAIRLTPPDCNSTLLASDNLRLIIQAPNCKYQLKSTLCFRGCWPGFDTPWRNHVPPHELPAIIYPSFGTNDDGETVFRFDDKLFKLPPGRYFGFVEFTNGQRITKLDLDLCNTQYLADRVVVSSVPCSATGEYK